MAAIVGVFLGLLLRTVLQWILGKGWGLFFTLFWLAAFVFFGLSKLSPPFPFELLRGASATVITFSIIGVIVVPFAVAKIAIQESTNNAVKAWTGGILFCLMTASILMVWAVMTPMDRMSYRKEQFNREFTKKYPCVQSIRAETQFSNVMIGA